MLPRKVRLSCRTVLAAPPSPSRRVYEIRSRTGPVPSAEILIAPDVPLHPTMLAAWTEAGRGTEVPPCRIVGGGGGGGELLGARVGVGEVRRGAAEVRVREG
ncbi:hypothetical protein, partial [Nonomuraea sp. NPDC049784]|uniref:hypothetical protein n=1 Tax=Nonomuraea sp. NPDC049784 TaxID=3154361 RepID=UPI0033F190EC